MLKIENKPNFEKAITLGDLHAGELFTFIGQADVLMKTDYYNYFIYLENGELVDGDDEGYTERPVITLDAKLVFEK